jgi:hypothetical protein
MALMFRLLLVLRYLKSVSLGKPLCYLSKVTYISPRFIKVTLPSIKHTIFIHKDCKITYLRALAGIFSHAAQCFIAVKLRFRKKTNPTVGKV